jgi:hypothetical protein
MPTVHQVVQDRAKQQQSIWPSAQQVRSMFRPEKKSYDGKEAKTDKTAS